MGGVDSADDEKEDGGNERTGCGGTVPPPYAENSSSFGLLERAAEEGGNDNAAFHLQKARKALIEAHASKPMWQADVSFFSRPKEGGEGRAAALCCMVPVWCSWSCYRNVLFWICAPTEQGVGSRRC